jgi:protease-4
MQTGIAAGRGKQPAEVAAAIDSAIFTAERAREAGLVDVVATYEEFRGAQTGDLPWKQVKLKDSPAGGFDMEKLQTFLGLVPPKRPSEPHVALVYALGGIVDGRGAGILGARQQIAGRTLSAAIDRLADDDKVRAIVMRVDSPGGSAMASEQIWRAVQRAKAKKPVIVSMGGVAGSGGYYISCGATKIYALANTMTGSIGVVGGKLGLGPMLAKVGVATYEIGKGKRAGIWSPFHVWDDGERKAVLAMMEEVYKLFVERVAAGRGKEYEQIHAIAQGRIWTGAAAHERGLVDALGGLTDALAEARQVAGVGPEIALEVYPPEPTLKDLFEGLDPSVGLVRMGVTPDLLTELRATLGAAGLGEVAGALAQLDALRDQPIQTALYWPVLVR